MDSFFPNELAGDNEERWLFVDEDKFFSESIDKHWLSWLQAIPDMENKKIGTVCFHYCSDDFLYNLNVAYLQHDTLTDIISFEYSRDPIEGDIYISLERANENAQAFNRNLEEELLRLHAHGLLHFCGYKDKTGKQKEIMREKEDFYIRTFYSSEHSG
jgi:probable rRNA maturation factor